MERTPVVNVNTSISVDHTSPCAEADEALPELTELECAEPQPSGVFCQQWLEENYQDQGPNENVINEDVTELSQASKYRILSPYDGLPVKDAIWNDQENDDSDEAPTDTRKRRRQHHRRGDSIFQPDDGMGSFPGMSSQIVCFGNSSF